MSVSVLTSHLIFAAEEVINFSQSDLVEDDVMLLDVGHTIFLWYGNDSNKAERDGAVKLGNDYLKSDPAGRDQDTSLLIVKQGFEPPTFTGFFGAWDRSLWSVSTTHSSQIYACFSLDFKMKLSLSFRTI